MNDATVKTMVYLFAGLLSIYPVLELLFKKKKWWYKGIIVIVLCFFWYVTIRYKNILDREAVEANVKAKRSDSLFVEARENNKILQSKVDSSVIYLDRLKEEISSIKNVSDTQKKVFNNYIDKIETLNQY